MKIFERFLWVLVTVYICLAAWPATFWYDVGAMRVPDVVEGEPIELLYSGGVNRPFFGSYSVVLRHTVTGEIVGEGGGGPFPYETGTYRPDPLYIDWWVPSDERIHQPEPGSYTLKTCWTVHGAFYGIVPDKTICMGPALFKVSEAK